MLVSLNPGSYHNYVSHLQQEASNSNYSTNVNYSCLARDVISFADVVFSNKMYSVSTDIVDKRRKIEENTNYFNRGVLSYSCINQIKTKY